MPTALIAPPARTRVRKASCQSKPGARPPRLRSLSSRASGVEMTNGYTATDTEVVRRPRSTATQPKSTCDNVRASSPKSRLARALSRGPERLRPKSLISEPDSSLPARTSEVEANQMSLAKALETPAVILPSRVTELAPEDEVARADSATG